MQSSDQMPDLSKLYRFRFREADRLGKKRIWKVLCERFFQPLIGEDRVIVDLACGYGEFINNIRGRKKYAVDLNPDARAHLGADVEFCLSRADAMTAIADASVDVVFASNFLEHLRTKDECDRVFAEVRRILRLGGRFVIMGPNIRYLAAEYWDFYDHYLPLSHLSLEEGLVQADYEIERLVARFLPYTTRSRVPQHASFVAFYLAVPFVWRILGKQFLVVARKPAAIGQTG
ncbi:MAG: class I SAM-dependent methyltransferase [Pseudolabrys sp.]|nr:class I SAM-dependent methyltransferase [Pseudolabrys sp.]